MALSLKRKMHFKFARDFGFVIAPPPPESKVRHRRRLSGLHHAADCPRELLPFGMFCSQMPSASCSQPVVLRVAVLVWHCLPTCGDPTALAESIQSGIQRAVIDAQDFIG